ncbi:carboxypeptidase-like regulatory domain-containing protein [Chondrinema litorale]|uniref:carboxypeptidase-like regulatory domain-containing protein n=1 Tax=Chondrinema litorale TaxID=2994555 RepID=UPI002542CF5A|nr:carboxypeptidase-like regulatory domain-containing protein [Chondrinema litorale]UZR94407.1 carboxypeptidase-like regulatory domain-containing protein [Chondrinema litorale]
MKQLTEAITICILILVSIGTTLAETSKNRLITGKVLSEDASMSIPGVSIKVEESNIGGITNAEGKFTLRVPQGNLTLVFSLAGYLDKKIEIAEDTENLEIILQPNNAELTRNTNNRVQGKPRDNFYISSDKSALYASIWDDTKEGNWENFMDLLIDEGYDKIEDQWGMYVENRVTTYVETEKNEPISNAVVIFYSRKEKQLWKAVTDQSGKVEMWPDMFEFIPSDKYTAVVEYDDKSQSFKAIRAGGGVYHLIFKSQAKADKAGADIVLTGNLSENTNKDLQSIIQSFQNVKQKFEGTANINSEFIFHHQYDPNGFDIDFIKDFEYKNKSATIDASYEYALAKIVEMYEWSEEKQARFLFWAVDDLPSVKSTNKELIKASVKEAAAKGIQIVPIVTKSIDKETEMFLRFVATATNGEYIFLTDLNNTNYIKPSVGPIDAKPFENILEEFLKDELKLEEM